MCLTRACSVEPIGKDSADFNLGPQNNRFVAMSAPSRIDFIFAHITSLAPGRRLPIGEGVRPSDQRADRDSVSNSSKA